MYVAISAVDGQFVRIAIAGVRSRYRDACYFAARSALLCANAGQEITNAVVASVGNGIRVSIVGASMIAAAMMADAQRSVADECLLVHW
jgi:hypothetical protein